MAENAFNSVFEPDPNATPQENFTKLSNYLHTLTEYLRYAFGNIGTESFNGAALSAVTTITCLVAPLIVSSYNFSTESNSVNQYSGLTGMLKSIQFTYNSVNHEGLLIGCRVSYGTYSGKPLYYGLLLSDIGIQKVSYYMLSGNAVIYTINGTL